VGVVQGMALIERYTIENRGELLYLRAPANSQTNVTHGTIKVTRAYHVTITSEHCLFQF
jgi:hypothetical protein